MVYSINYVRCLSLVDEIFFGLGVEVKSIGSYDEVFFPFWGVANYIYNFIFILVLPLC